MQQLHLVGFTTDLEGLIFSARRGAKSGGFTIALDERLLAVLEEALRLRGERDDAAGEEESADPRTPHHPSRGVPARRAPRPESHLTPREIQARLRGGRTIEEIASEAGVDEEWIARFAAPIQAEQRQVVGRARDLVFSKSRVGPSTQPLGTSVLWNLVDKGLALTEAEYEGGWGAYHLRDTSWVVRFEYVSRRRSQVAEWEVDLREGELWSLNRLATDLGYVEPGRRKRRIAFADPPPEPAPAPVEARVTPPPPVSRSTRPPAAAPVEAKRASRPPARKPAARKATTKAAAGTAGKVGTRAPARRAPAKSSTTRALSRKLAAATTPTSRKGAARPKPRPVRAAAKKAAAKKPMAKKASPARAKTSAAATSRATTRRTSAGRPASRRVAKAAKRAPAVRAPAVPNRTVGVSTSALPPARPSRPSPVVPLAAQPPAPPGGRRPPPAAPVRPLVPPAPAADLVTAWDHVPRREAEPAVRIIPAPSRPPTAVPPVVRIDTRSPEVVASADRRAAAADGDGAPRTRVRRVPPRPAEDPSPQPRPAHAGNGRPPESSTDDGPPVRIRADRAASGPGAPVPADEPAGRRRRRSLRSR